MKIQRTMAAVSSNKSMALWCVPSGIALPSLDAHFNYWYLTGDERFSQKTERKARDFIEIGVMLERPEDVEMVCIYIPQPPASISVTDCCDYFASPDIAQGIFNEALTTSSASSPGPRFVELRTGANVFCRVHRFMRSGSADAIDTTDLEVVSLAEGTLLTITKQAIAELCRHNATPARGYFRLRVSLQSTADSAFVRTIPTPDRLLQSGFHEIKYVDFRLNEARTLPDQVETRMRSDRAKGTFVLRFVAFLTALPVLSELSASTSPAYKVRLLEHQLWNDYVPTGIPEGMVVYHWKRQAPEGIADFSAFVKLQTRRSGRRTLIQYLAVAFAFGILGNLAASGLQALFSHDRDSSRQRLVGGPTQDTARATPARARGAQTR